MPARRKETGKQISPLQSPAPIGSCSKPRPEAVPARDLTAGAARATLPCLRGLVCEVHLAAGDGN